MVPLKEEKRDDTLKTLLVLFIFVTMKLIRFTKCIFQTIEIYSFKSYSFISLIIFYETFI